MRTSFFLLVFICLHPTLYGEDVVLLHFFFFFSISNDKFFIIFFILLDILLVELVCKFIVIKKINFYKLLNFCFLFNRGMKINLHKLLFLSSYLSSQPNKKNFQSLHFSTPSTKHIERKL